MLETSQAKVSALGYRTSQLEYLDIDPFSHDLVFREQALVRRPGKRLLAG